MQRLIPWMPLPLVFNVMGQPEPTAVGERSLSRAIRAHYRRAADYLGLNVRWDGGLAGQRRGHEINVTDDPAIIMVPARITLNHHVMEQCFWLIQKNSDAGREYVLDAIPASRRPMRLTSPLPDLATRYEIWSRPTDFAGRVLAPSPGLRRRIAGSRIRRLDANWLFPGIRCHLDANLTEFQPEDLETLITLAVDLVEAIEANVT